MRSKSCFLKTCHRTSPATVPFPIALDSVMPMIGRRVSFSGFSSLAISKNISGLSGPSCLTVTELLWSKPGGEMCVTMAVRELCEGDVFSITPVLVSSLSIKVGTHVHVPFVAAYSVASCTTIGRKSMVREPQSLPGKETRGRGRGQDIYLVGQRPSSTSSPGCIRLMSINGCPRTHSGKPWWCVSHATNSRHSQKS